MTIKRKKEIEQLTMDLLSEYGITENPGAHLAEICEGEGIDLVPYDDWDVQTCGRIIQKDEQYIIFYNAKHTKEMQAFTIAHELGHYFLHHLDDEEPEIICLDRDFQRIEVERNAREVEANFFASCLLLPLDLVVPLFEKVLKYTKRESYGKLYVDKQQQNFHDYSICMQLFRNRFTASDTAIRLRLINLGKMVFNIQFEPSQDRGISIAQYLERQARINQGR